MPGGEMERLMEAMGSHYFGKYRGEVVSTDDPLSQGRLQVKIPAVMGEEALWAMPCSPYAGRDIGFFALPPAGSRIWVEFEGGNTDHPIWSGCYWLEGQLPADAAPDVVVLRTPGVTIRIEDSGTIEIETTGGTKIVLSGTELTLDAPTIKQSADGGAVQLSASGFDAMNGALTVV